MVCLAVEILESKNVHHRSRSTGSRQLTSTVGVVGMGTSICSRSAARLANPLKIAAAVLSQTAQAAVKVAVYNHICQEIELVNLCIFFVCT